MSNNVEGRDIMLSPSPAEQEFRQYYLLCVYTIGGGGGGGGGGKLRVLG